MATKKHRNLRKNALFQHPNILLNLVNQSVAGEKIVLFHVLLVHFDPLAEWNRLPHYMPEKEKSMTHFST